jgi:dephospho-CoA kinase
MLKIGLTGGIGSGKSAVSSVFSKSNIPVYDSDQRAKWLMNNNNFLKDSIVKLFGSQAYSEEVLDRAYVSSVVFNDSSKLLELNKLVHPAVSLDFKNWANQFKNASFIVKEAAILIESEAYKEMDLIVLVVCDLNKRIKRVINRDHLNVENVEKRVAQQLSDENKIKYADYVITNEGSLKDLELKVNNIIRQIKMNSKSLR